MDGESEHRRSVSLNMLLAGNVHALDRLCGALEARDGKATFRAAFEALNWATSVDDRIRKQWAPEGEALNWGWRSRVSGAEVMAGIRFARNRVHHHWADAIVLDAGSGGSQSGCRWPPLEGLPAGPADHGEDVYVDLVAGKPVEQMLVRLGLAFEKVLPLLEPPTPARA